MFQVRDGLVVIGCPNDQLFFKIMNVLGLQERAKDPRFATYGSRKANERALLDAIEPGSRVKWEAEALSALGVPCSKVNSYKDVFDNEHAQRKIEIEGVHQHAGPPRRCAMRSCSTRMATIDRMAPLLGEQTVEILSQCGYAQMRSSG